MVTQFINYIIPEAKEHIAKRKLWEWCPVASEAVLFLMLENSYELWMEEAEMDEYSNSSPTKMAKWTERRGSGRKFGGWGNDRIKQFNVLYQRIKRQRERHTTGTNLEKKLLESATTMGLAGKKRRLADMQQGEAPLFDMPTEFDLV
mmetsp:Transcript_169/g.194  ORF Transcript_169/g.194 Transcript_169/m.194 type:complete len:147 (-) Transcript_169:93-533(-)